MFAPKNWMVGTVGILLSLEYYFPEMAFGLFSGAKMLLVSGRLNSNGCFFDFRAFVQLSSHKVVIIPPQVLGTIQGQAGVKRNIWKYIFNHSAQPKKMTNQQTMTANSQPLTHGI